ncbi:MAG TPA: M12 family metallo-peptidase [Longimicrobium sp.]|nr:M12 family metallo-peptidase [Longimicrobium sp.]
MRARLSLVIAATFGLAACQGDNVNPVDPTPVDEPAATQENLLTLSSDAALNAPQSQRLTAIRGRRETMTVSVARMAATPSAMLRQGSALRISVAPGVEVVAIGERVVKRAPNDISWAGPVEGRNDGWVQAVFMEGGITGTITLGKETYSIEPIGGGLHAVARLDQNAFPSEHPADNPSGALILPTRDPLSLEASLGPSYDVSLAATSTINVLVVYTASAATAAGNILSKIQLAIDETNQSYVNSGISINMVGVASLQVTYNEASRSFSQHVNALVSSTDGLMDNVHTLRNTYGADMVMLVVNDSEACGQAAAIKATATNAFAVSHWSCITGYYSFAHELGHLQGARHDRFVDGSTSPYTYGHGYIPSTKNWRTIMSYGNNCSNCTRIQWWSSPLKTYPPTGQVMGTTTYEDNARVLNGTAATVAAFR